MGVLSVDYPVAIDVAALARVCYCESRGEVLEAKIWAMDVVRNRAKEKGVSIVEATYTGLCRGKLDVKLVKLAAKVLRREVSNRYRYFFNPITATDLDWVRYGFSQPGEYKGVMWFF